VGGYVRGEDLFCLEYDFRVGVAGGAARLAALVDRIRGMTDEQVDLIGISSGGAIARYYMAYGDSDAPITLGDARERPPTITEGLEAVPPVSHAAKVRRIVYVGAPQRGSVSTVDRLHFGVVPAPFARLRTGHRHWQTLYDFLPHPDDPVFVDEEGRALDIDLYDAATWARLRIADPSVPDLAGKLARARRLHRALDGAGAHPDALVIGARNLATTTRLVVTGGAVRVPPCEPEPGNPLRAIVYEPGDGAISEATMRAVPGLDQERVWYVSPVEHASIPATPDVHRLILEALLASDRPIPVGTGLASLSK
jgi:hypothetical protein